jgi:glucose/arabinose dehydrogenase
MNIDFRKSFWAIAMLFLVGPVLAQSKLVPQRVALKNGKKFDLNLPADFEIVPAAEGLKRVRFFAKAPDGRIFVTDLYNLTDNKHGAIYILDGWNPETGKFAKVIPYMTGLHNPNSVQFYRDAQGQDWIYIAETQALTRRKFNRGEERPTDTNPQTIATFPDYGLSYKYGGWHLTRTIAFSPSGKLYVSVGSSCNSCVEKERVRASVLEMNPDGTESRIFARGLRNAVGLKWFGNFLFATNQGSDHLGLQKPDETFYALKGGADYGWPYCHSSNGKIFADPKIKRRGGCANVAAPYSYLPARSSALGFDYFDNAESPDVIKNAFLVSLHGSTDKAIGHGYKIAILRKGERLGDLITGFLQGRNVVGRPCDIMKLDANSFLFTDDYTGIVYYVRKKGWKSEVAVNNPENQAVNVAAEPTKAETTEPGSSCLSVFILFSGAILRLFA